MRLQEMNRKTKWLFSFSILLLLILIIEIIYIKQGNSLNKDTIVQKEKFILLSTIPDLAISTEANYIRYRSLSDLFSIYRDDPELREQFPTTFVYSHSHILNKDSNIEK